METMGRRAVGLFIGMLLASVCLSGCSGKAEETPAVARPAQEPPGQGIPASGTAPGDVVKRTAPRGGTATGQVPEKPTDNSDEESASSLVYTREYYSYRTRRGEDPFVPLLTEEGELKGLTLSMLSLTGVLWNDQQSLAVMEDSHGRGYLLKVGDQIAGARLVAIRKDAAVFRVVEFGVVHNIEKDLFVEEERPL
jgi:hypothetical protein